MAAAAATPAVLKCVLEHAVSGEKTALQNIVNTRTVVVLLRRYLHSTISFHAVPLPLIRSSRCMVPSRCLYLQIRLCVVS